MNTEAAHHLLGLELADGWRVTKKLDKIIGHSGGYFSICYLVEKDGEIAFLKALNYEAFFNLNGRRNTIDSIQLMTKAFQYERDLLTMCRNSKLSKVVLIYDSGEHLVTGDFHIKEVPYLIFELADGDANSKLFEFSKDLDITWKLFSLHDVAVGIRQLHNSNVAHQDIKPSNIFTYPENISKIGDLGRSICTNISSPHDNEEFTGDRTYRPPEILYRYVKGNWLEKNYGIDLYLLGSLVSYYFTGVNMTNLLMSNLDESLHWNKWKGNPEDIIPYLIEAFGMALDSIQNSIQNDYLGIEIRKIVQMLCDPNPFSRGHPKTILFNSNNQFELERIITRFAVLKQKAKFSLLKK